MNNSAQGAANGVAVDTERLDGDEFGPFDDAVAGDVRDPYPELAEARRAFPVRRVDASSMPHEEASPVFFVYRYNDVTQVLRDGETFSSGQIIELIMGDVMGEHIMLGMDDPEHRRYRALVSTAFRQKVLTEWESELIEPVASELVDAFAERGHAELVREFTFPTRRRSSRGFLGCRGTTTRDSSAGRSPFSASTASATKPSLLPKK